MIELLECTCIEAYKARKMRDPNCCACSCDHNDLVEQLAKANERVAELEINIKSQLPAYKAIREAFMDGVFWYEQSNKVNQIELDKEAHKYANHEIERQQLRKEQE